MSTVVDFVKASGTLSARIITPAIAVLAASALVLTLGSPSADAKKRSYSKKQAQSESKPKGPLTIVVSIGSQRVSVYDGTRRIDGAPLSSGARGHWTPRGIFTVLQKNRRHYSNLYGGAPMPNMQRITWSGIAMHAGHLPGYPASHGCIRLPHSFSKRLFGITKLGTRVVVVSQGQPAPKRIDHENLLKPLPIGTPENTAEESASLNFERRIFPDKPTIQKANATAADLEIRATHVRADTDSSKPTPRLKPERPTGSALTRTSLLEFREKEIAYLEQFAGLNREERATAATALKAANLEVREAQRNAATARNAAGKLSKTIAKSIRGRYQASREMQVFMTANRTIESDEAADKAAEREAAIEQKMMKNEAETEIARKELKDIQPIIKRLNDILAAKKDTRDVHLRASTKASKRYSKTLKALTEAKGAIEHRGKPITVFISRKTMKMYVRRGWEPLFEAPIDIVNPEAPMGTHFYQAYSYTSDNNDLLWQAVRAYRTDTNTKKKWRKKSKMKRGGYEYVEETINSRELPAQSPRNALDRIRIPLALRARLAELITPDSAMVVSDNGIGNETGAYTDIIVLTK